MTLQQAAKESHDSGGHRWFRPAGHKGYGFVYDGQTVKNVPGARGGFWAQWPTLQDLLGEWEVVNPEDVCDEK